MRNRMSVMLDMLAMYPVIIVVVLIVMFLASAIRILNEYQRVVIFRLGRIIATKGPGSIILIPIIDKMVRIDMLRRSRWMFRRRTS
jgi:regulator of protease activity HflC (stomatin/prohibitin superfamily)